MSVKLSKRLNAVYAFVDMACVLDIGCDHGKLIEKLFESKKITYAFVSDISSPSLLKAVNLLKDNNRNFDFDVADGFSNKMLNKNLQQCIISGIGGFEIIKILSNNITDITKFVLQPQNNWLELKKYLVKNNYKIVNDVVIKDKNIFYNVIKTEKTLNKNKLSQFQLRFGDDNYTNKNEDFILYLKYLENKYEKLLFELPKFKKHTIKTEIKFIKKAIIKWEKIYGKNVAISKN